MYIMLDDL